MTKILHSAALNLSRIASNNQDASFLLCYMAAIYRYTTVHRGYAVVFGRLREGNRKYRVVIRWYSPVIPDLGENILRLVV